MISRKPMRRCVGLGKGADDGGVGRYQTSPGFGFGFFVPIRAMFPKKS